MLTLPRFEWLAPTSLAEVLRLLAEEVSVGVGEYKHAVIALNHADLSARVTRQSCMTRRMQITGAHAHTCLELRRDRCIDRPPARPG